MNINCHKKIKSFICNTFLTTASPTSTTVSETAIKEKDATKAEKIANEHIINAMKNIDEHDLW